MVRIFIMAFLTIAYLCLPFSTAAAASDFNSRAAGMAEIKGVRIHATEDKVRIVVDADKEVDYKTTVLKNPDRVVVDLSAAWLNAKAAKSQTLSSKFATKARIAQHDPSTVRIVVETTQANTAETYDVFSLTGGSAPYRVVLDFGNLHANTHKADTTGGQTDKGKPASEQTDTPAQQPAATPASTTTNTSLSGKKIAIDAGHGGNDTGAIGPAGTTEKSVTLRIAKKVQEILTANGAQVFMTRTTDTEVSPKHANATDDEELQARCDVANDNNADVFVCIHLDSFSSGAARGTTGYYYADASANGIRLADAVRAGVVKQLKTDDRGAKSCHFYVVKHTVMPATLVEVAFLSNPQEEKLLNSDAGVQRAAQGIVDGLVAYFG